MNKTNEYWNNFKQCMCVCSVLFV